MGLSLNLFMTFPLLLIWLFQILLTPSQTLARIDNEHLNLAQFAYEQAVENGINPAKFLRLVDCESRLNKDAIGDYGASHGILQFQERTFLKFQKIYGIEGTWPDPKPEIELAVKMISNGFWYHWKSCGIRIGLDKDF